MHAEATEAHKKVLDLQKKQAAELADLQLCFRRERARYVQQLLKITASVEQGQTFIRRLESENAKLRESLELRHSTGKGTSCCGEGRQGQQLALGERTNRSSSVATTTSSATAAACAPKMPVQPDLERNATRKNAVVDAGAASASAAGAAPSHGKSWKSAIAQKGSTPTQQNYLKALDHLHKMLEQTKDTREAR